MPPPFRRFVTGHDADSKSIFILEDREPATHAVDSGGTRVTEHPDVRGSRLFQSILSTLVG
jgi:hypothetical protein